MDYSIVIPVYNEEDKILSSLTQITNFMKGFCNSFEIIVVNDGSKDSTLSKVESYAKDNPEIVSINNVHKGKGFAVWTGMMRAKGDYIYMADADLSAPIEDLKKFSVWAKDQNFDVVIGSREGFGAKRIGEPAYRHVMGRIFNWFVQLVALPGINDSQCGFKFFSKKAAKDIFGRMLIYGEQSKEIDTTYFGAWDVEVLYLARKLGYTIKQIPLTWVYVKSKNFSALNNSFKMVKDVIKVKINDLKGKYDTVNKSQTDSII